MTVPFYIFYSMFGFQRVGDLAWAAGDARARGFLLGATSGRTTLMGEGVEQGILKGMYRLSASEKPVDGKHVQLMGCGSILQEVVAAAQLLEQDFGVSSEVWSVTSLTELRRDGQEAERWNLLHPEHAPRIGYVESCLQDKLGPVVVATDYMKIFADQIRPFVPNRRFVALGTDGFGQSDTRESLRRFFEVDRHFIALAALKALADDGKIPREKVTEAIRLYGIDPQKQNPAKV